MAVTMRQVSSAPLGAPAPSPAHLSIPTGLSHQEIPRDLLLPPYLPPQPTTVDLSTAALFTHPYRPPNCPRAPRDPTSHAGISKLETPQDLPLPPHLPTKAHFSTPALFTHPD